MTSRLASWLPLGKSAPRAPVTHRHNKELLFAWGGRRACGQEAFKVASYAESLRF